MSQCRWLMLLWWPTLTGTWTVPSTPLSCMRVPIGASPNRAPVCTRQAAFQAPGPPAGFEAAFFRSSMPPAIVRPRLDGPRRPAVDGSGQWCEGASSCNVRARVRARSGPFALCMMSGDSRGNSLKAGNSGGFGSAGAGAGAEKADVNKTASPTRGRKAESGVASQPAVSLRRSGKRVRVQRNAVAHTKRHLF